MLSRIKTKEPLVILPAIHTYEKVQNVISCTRIVWLCNFCFNILSCVFLIFYTSMRFDFLHFIMFTYPTALWLQHSINELIYVWPRYLVQCEQLWNYSISQFYLLSEMFIWAYLFKSVQCLTKGNDNNKLAGGEKVGDGMQNGDESSCGWTRWTKGKLISE